MSRTPLGDLGAQAVEARRRLEELLDLLQLGHRFVGTGHVGEGDLLVLLARRLGLGPAELQQAGPARLGGVQQEQQQTEEQDDRQVAPEQRRPDRRVRMGNLIGGAAAGDVVEHAGRGPVGEVDRVGLSRVQLAGDGVGVVMDGGRRHLMLLEQALVVAEADGLGARTAAQHADQDQAHDDGQPPVQERAAQNLPHGRRGYRLTRPRNVLSGISGRGGTGGRR